MLESLPFLPPIGPQNGSKIALVNEAWISKTCSCGHAKHKLGGAKVHKYSSSCGVERNLRRKWSQEALGDLSPALGPAPFREVTLGCTEALQPQHRELSGLTFLKLGVGA